MSENNLTQITATYYLRRKKVLKVYVMQADSV